MNAVGIDVSKGKSMVAALRPMGEVALPPKEYPHSEVGLEQMAYAIIALGEDTRVVMEATGRYHEPVAAALHEYGIYVTVLNPLLIQRSGGGSIRKVKTNRADARNGWTLSCPFGTANVAAVSGEYYRKWRKRKGYNFSEAKALDLYADSCGHITTLPKNENAKLLITTATQQLLAAKTTLVAMRTEMLRLAKLLPEYDTVLALYGVGEITAAQLMAEIGDVRRYPRRRSLVAFTGVDPAVNRSGKHEARSNSTTKRGSLHLRKTLYQVVCTYLEKSPADEPAYQFLDKKRAEGKPYFVYMTAGANKFLRICCARVKERLAAPEATGTAQK